MFEEELPAIISIAVISLVLFTAFYQDMRRLRRHYTRISSPSRLQQDQASSPQEQWDVDATQAEPCVLSTKRSVSI